MLFEGQLEDPSAPGHRLYPTRFCRECGHEVHVVTKTEDAEGIAFLPRNIDDAPLDDQEGDTAGYLTPTGDGDPDYAFTGEIETYPEDWREERNGVERLRANRKRRVPQMITGGPGWALQIYRGRAFGSYRASSVSARAASTSRIPACGNAPSSRACPVKAEARPRHFSSRPPWNG